MSRRDDHFEDWQDDEREPSRARRPRKQLTPYGTLRVHFGREMPATTADALATLRKAGLL